MKNLRKLLEKKLLTKDTVAQWKNLPCLMTDIQGNNFALSSQHNFDI